MKKKLLSLFLILSILVCSLSVINFTVLADDTDANGTFKYTSSTGTLEIFSDDIMVDKTEDTMSSYPWFTYKSSIEHIIIHDGVTKISDLAFSRQDNLTDVVIPDSVVSIGNSAFAGNDNLNKLILSDNVTEIGNYAFGFNSQMLINPNFECVCSSSSYAQTWCLKNYVPFQTPFSFSGAESVCVGATGKKQYFWSFVPSVDCTVSFFSSSKYDTEGLIYDFDSYKYNDNYEIMKNSSLYYSDDVGDDLNFKLQKTLKAGKRYYLSTKFKLPSKVGAINVKFNFSCLNHSFYADSLEQDFISDNYDTVLIKCQNCNETESMLFIDAFKQNLPLCDVNGDGIVNAKDYSILLKNSD